MKYSQLMIVNQVDQVLLDHIRMAVLQGIKVFIATVKRIEEATWFEEAKLAKLLHVYEIQGNESIPFEELSLIDGHITNIERLQWLDLHSDFNLAQFQLEHEQQAQHICVTAGAGTGKTTTMISRILALKHLIADFSFSSVAMITFTNEAAIHMRKKLMEQLLNYYQYTGKQQYLEWMEQATEMFIGTIHAFAKQMLERESHALNLPRGLKIHSYRSRRKWWVEQQINIFRHEKPEVYQLFEHYPHYQLVKLVLKVMTVIQQKSLTDQEIQQLVVDEDKEQLHQLIEFVLKRAELKIADEKKEKHSLELSDLISYLQKFKQTDQTGLRTTLTHLFIDEFQDTDEMQVEFVVELLRLYGVKLFAVGDIKQSIYRFRGANYTAFEQLKHHLREETTTHISLQKNYRSDSELLKKLNADFKQWSRKVERFSFQETDELVAVKKHGTGVIGTYVDESEIVQLIRKKQAEGRKIAALVRSNRQVNAFVQLLEENGVFCEASVSGDFYRSPAVKEFYLLVRRFTHPKVAKDRFLFAQSSYWRHEVPEWEQYISFEQRNLIQHLDEIEAEDQMEWSTWLQTKSTIDALEAIVTYSNPAVRYAMKFYRQRCSGWSGEIPQSVIAHAQLEAEVRMKEYEMNLQQLLYVLKTNLHSATTNLFDLEQFLQREMATNTELSQLKLTNAPIDRVRVMTVHKAKGLEFDYVVLPYTDFNFIQKKRDTLLLEKKGQWKLMYKVWIEDVEFRSERFTESMQEEELEIQAEEARMLYVAVTRAENGIIYRQHVVQSFGKVDKWASLLGTGGV